jgi:dihydrofolate reductase
MIRSIFAVDLNGGLGKDGTLPWPKDPEDLRWFKTNTTGDIVVMGKNTWMDPMMPKPLPNRLNVVATSKEQHACDAAHVIITGKDIHIPILALQENHPNRAVWIIGGASLLKSTLHLVDEIYLTRFNESYDCDVTMDIDSYLNGFRLVQEHPGTNKRFQIYAKLS